MEYPLFFDEHIRSVIDAYNQARSQIKSSAGFVFITDVHIHLNGRASVPLILKIGEQTDVKDVLVGGDYCWAFGSKAQCIADLKNALSYLAPIGEHMRLHLGRGNHDATIRSSWELNTGYTMPYEQVQAYFAAYNSRANSTVDGKLYFYSDDTCSKTRFVVLDTCEPQLDENCPWGVRNGMHDAQLQWLCEDALQFEEPGWSVVVMGHVPCIDAIPGYDAELDPLNEIFSAFRNKHSCKYRDFSDAQGELVMYLCGHNHKDRHGYSQGVLHVSTGCDAYCKDDDLPRGVGTTDNALFDLILIDKDEGTVQMFRVGAGTGRTFTYR